MDSSNIYRFNGIDPFDNWTIKEGCLIGYYPRNSIINGLSQTNGVTISKDALFIPNTVISISGSCFREVKRFKTIFIPDSVKRISRSAFISTEATLIVSPGSYAEQYAKKHGFKVEGKF